METVKLKLKKRDSNVKAKDYRKQGLVTAEYYGKDVPNLNLVVGYQDFKKAYSAAGKNTVLDLEIEGDKSTHALIHEVDYDPVSDKYINVDFLHVDLNKNVDTKIPFVFVGVSPAVKDLQGTLTTPLDGLEVRCLAKDLIHSIEVDISGIVDFNSVIRVSDLKVPSTMTVLTDPTLVVATAVPVKEEKEEVPVAAVPAEGEAATGTATPAAPGAATPAEGGGDKGAESKK
jgi:large subunit ribosomal protein L25